MLQAMLIVDSHLQLQSHHILTGNVGCKEGTNYPAKSKPDFQQQKIETMTLCKLNILTRPKLKKYTTHFDEV